MTAPAATGLAVVEAPELDARFDPRTGNTGEWLGGDIAATIPFGDGRILWLFGDCFWGTAGATTRSGSQFKTGSIAVQSTPDLATADLTFYRPPSNRAVYFEIPGDTHDGWPQSGLFIGDDLYVWSIRVSKADTLGTEAGWCLHRIVAAKTTDPATWDPALLYESGDTDTRPTLSPYDGGDGFVYAFAMKHLSGVTLARWSMSDLVAGNAGTTQYAGLGGWTSDPAGGYQFASSVLGTEGTFHKRPDGRWVFIDAGVEFPGSKIQARLSEKSGGVYYPSSRYLPIEPLLQVGDAVDIPGDSASGFITAAPTPTTRTVEVWGGGVLIRDVSAMTARLETKRYIYDPPVNVTNPGTWVYGARAHPQLTGGTGLVIGYSTNSAPELGTGPGSAWEDMSIYWPRFVRVLPPTITDLSVTSGGVVSWRAGGAPDRIMVRQGSGAWAEVAPTATSYTLTGYTPGNDVTVRAIGIGGETLRSPIDFLPNAQPRSIEWLIVPRERNLSRVYDPITNWTSLRLIERHNLPDTWSVTGPSEEMGAFAPAGGSILFRGDQQITSGKLTNLRRFRVTDPSTGASTDTTVATFTSDLLLIGQRVVLPSPQYPMSTTAVFNFPDGYDQRSGSVEAVILGYIRAHAGDLARPDRRISRLRLPANQGRGGTTQVSGRFDALGVLLQSLAEAGNLRISVKHTEDAAGAWLDVVIESVRDLSADIRFGTAESTATGIITDWSYEIGAPGTTRAVVAGGGEMEGRDILLRRNNAPEDLWGMSAETLVDQRQVPPLGNRDLMNKTSWNIQGAIATVTKSHHDDEFLRSFVAGSTVDRTASLGWSWLVGWDQVRLWDLTEDRLTEIANDVRATTDEDSVLANYVNDIRTAWSAALALDDDIRGKLSDALLAAWEAPPNELAHAAAIISATTLLDQRIATAWNVLGSIYNLAAEYAGQSESFWQARVASTFTELSRGGDEALDEGAGLIKVEFTPTLGPDLEYRRDVRVGDIVGYDLPGLEPAKDKIREATTTVAVESGVPTETVTVVVGTPDAPTSRTQQQTARALRGITVVQRST